eukprot:scaffold468392_cov17-Prasinocladus_malaysianus.AAC.1
MEQPEMWSEIQRLRERENTLLYAIKQLIAEQRQADDSDQELVTDEGCRNFSLVNYGYGCKTSKLLRNEDNHKIVQNYYDNLCC